MFDEQLFTPWAERGWQSWDEWSPERDFCRFVGLLQRVLRPKVVLETGVGVGRLTGHLDVDGCSYLGFESSPPWRRPPALPDQATPTAEQMATAEMVILDSNPPFRFGEITMWAQHGRPGSVCVIHDCGNGHPESWGTHHQLRAAVLGTGQPGVFLKNPRGGWMGWHL